LAKQFKRLRNELLGFGGKHQGNSHNKS